MVITLITAQVQIATESLRPVLAFIHAYTGEAESGFYVATYPHEVHFFCRKLVLTALGLLVSARFAAAV